MNFMPRKKNNELKAYSFLIVDENNVIPFETLTQKQKDEYIPRIMKNIGRAGSDYLNCHPDEARNYLEHKHRVMEKFTNAVAELDRHLNCTEIQDK